VPTAPTVARATTVLLVCAGGLAACSVAASAPRVAPGAPSIKAVVRSRFASTVELDHKGLLVAPPPKRAAVTVTEQEADAMFEATDAVEGPHEFAIFGLGIVTVAGRIENPAPTTTTTTAPPDAGTSPSTTATSSPPSSATSAPTTTTLPTTTTTTAPSTTTTTSATGTVPTTAPAPVTPAPPALPSYRRRLAWVGIVWGASATCPGSTTTRPSVSGTPTYVAIIIDARTGHRVIAYRSGGSSPCTGATEAPAVTEPNELMSVAWQPVGPASTAVQIQVPPCGSYYGWTQVPTAGGGTADQVVVSVPFDPTCATTVSQSQSVDQVVPLGSGQGLVVHAPVGPVDALQALPND
jgi:hypothetical protein